MIKYFLLLLFLIQLIYICTYVVLPIETLKKENYISPYTPNSPQDIIYSEQCSPIFTELDIGNPPQKIALLIELETNDYVIRSVHQEVKNISEVYQNKTLYDLSDSFLEKYSYFNENISTTFKSKGCQRRDIYYRYDEYEWPIAIETCPSNDTITFYKDIGMKSKTDKKSIYFDLVRYIKDNVTGILGLCLDGDRRTPSSFLRILKNNNFTNSYYWYFDFDSPKNEKGKLVIGSLLDELYGDKYDREDLNHGKANVGKVFWNLNFNKIFIKNSSETIDLKKDESELSFESNTILASYEYKQYFQKIIQNLLNEGKCFNDYFDSCKDLYNSKSNYSFYYCKNEKEVKEELKKIILPIQFSSIELNYTFEITIDDILKETKEYIFLKLIFQRWGGGWTMGRPFSLKYKFMFNPDIKQIAFYPKFKTKKGIQINWEIFIKVLIIIGLCIIFAILGIIVGKKLYGIKRKKRANEMNDDDYEYFSENKKTDGDNNNSNTGDNFNRNIIN